jgi:calcium-dependent protein kinase
VVRECIEISTGRRYAIKTIGKVPKRGLPTPRYLLKLRTEVEIMQQLGNSLDAVHLKVRTPRPSKSPYSVQGEG